MKNQKFKEKEISWFSDQENLVSGLFDQNNKLLILINKELWIKCLLQENKNGNIMKLKYIIICEDIISLSSNINTCELKD